MCQNSVDQITAEQWCTVYNIVHLNFVVQHLTQTCTISEIFDSLNIIDLYST